MNSVEVRAHTRVRRRPRSDARPGLILGACLPFFFAGASFAQTPQLRYNVLYSCNGEHIGVIRCRADSDMPGYPRTTPQNDYCAVYYPDRPKRGGLTVETVEMRGDVIRKLQACGALPITQDLSTQPNAEALTRAKFYLSLADQDYEKKDYAKALRGYQSAISADPDQQTMAKALDGVSGCQIHLGQYADALQAIQQLLRLKPNDAGVYSSMGWVYSELKEYPNALQAYRKAISLAPDASTLESADYKIGWIENEQNEYEKAVPFLRDAARLKPDDSGVQHELGYALYKLARYPRAITALQQAVRLKSDYVSAYSYLGKSYTALGKKQDKAKNDDMAFDTYARLIALKPAADQLQDAYFQIGWIHDDLQQYDKAIPFLREAVQLKGEDAGAECELGFAYYSVKRYSEALAALQRAVQLKHDYALAERYFGMTQLAMGRREDALKTYQALKTFDPAQAEALYREITGSNSSSGTPGATVTKNTTADAITDEHIKQVEPSAAQTYYAQGTKFREAEDYPHAIEVFKKAVALQPTMAEAYFGLGLCNFLSRHLSDALTAFQQAARLQPNDPDDQFWIGMAYDGLLKPAEAAAAYHNALRLNPQMSEAHWGLGVAYFEQKQLPSALSELQAAARIAPDDEQNQFWIGKVYVELKQYDKAVPALLEAQRLDPKESEVGKQLGYAYGYLGQNAKAAAALQQSVRLMPNDAEALALLGTLYAKMGRTPDALQVYRTLLPLDKEAAQDLYKYIHQVDAPPQARTSPEAQTSPSRQ